jgi:ribonuclease R
MDQIVGKEFVGMIHDVISNNDVDCEHDLSVHVYELGNTLVNVKTRHDIPKNNWIKIKITSQENNIVIGELLEIINDRIDTIIEEKFNLNKIRSSLKEPIYTRAGNKEHRDLTHHTVFTIDSDITNDCERGFSIQTIDDIAHIYVHISDVVHYINPSHPNFDSIIKRGNSFIGEKNKWGMLPEVYSDFICSILPLKNTYAITLEFIYNENEIRFVDWYYSTVRSCMRYTYEEADDLVDFDKLYNQDLSILCESSMHIKKYLNDFDLSISSISQNAVKYWLLYVNKIMSSEIGSIYRINLTPENNKFELLNNYIKHYHPDLTIDTSNREEIIDFVEKYETPLLYFILEDVITRGKYSNENNIHYGIGGNNYTHFTSPMNRSCDLLNQYLLKWVNFKEDIILDIPKYVKYMNDAESKQCKIYKFIQKYNIYQRTEIGDTFDGTIIEMNDNLLVLYIEELHAKYQIELPTTMSLSMFQNITVIVKSIMFDRIDFSVLCE